MDSFAIIKAQRLALLTPVPLDRSNEKKCLADFLFWFLLHMTPRLWEDALEIQKQALLKDNVTLSAQGAPKKSLGT